MFLDTITVRNIDADIIERLSMIAYKCSGCEEEYTASYFERHVAPTLNEYTPTDLLVLAAYLAFWGSGNAGLVVCIADKKKDKL